MPPSPTRSPPPDSASNVDVDEAQLPKGQCRYILIIPELKGQRCGCMGFDHNKAMPGATCQCGHLSCFHVASADAPSPSKNKAEIDLVKQRLRAFEQNFDLTDHDRLRNAVSRISELEETVDRNKEESAAELKGSYRNIHAAWGLVEQLQQRMKTLEDLCQSQREQMAWTGKEVTDLRNRQLELLDSDDFLEERIEKLESAEPLLSPPQDPTPIPSSPQVLRLSAGTTSPYRPSSNATQSSMNRGSSSSCNTKSWTVHVSLMPSKQQPFPFEKDTNSYKRCLSRGLHRMVGVEGDDAQAIMNAVSRSFQSLLKGRSWEPLQAKLCDAERLQGLPMLRPLDPKLSHGVYDKAFLREHCAVLDPNGKMDSLYIAMEHDTLSWNFLKRSPVYLEGLESAWEHDAFLDKKDERATTAPKNQDNGKESPPAGNIVVPLKRSVSEISCPGLDEMEGSRAKAARTCNSGRIELRRGVETAR